MEASTPTKFVKFGSQKMGPSLSSSSLGIKSLLVVTILAHESAPSQVSVYLITSQTSSSSFIERVLLFPNIVIEQGIVDDLREHFVQIAQDESFRVIVDFVRVLIEERVHTLTCKSIQITMNVTNYRGFTYNERSLKSDYLNKACLWYLSMLKI